MPPREQTITAAQQFHSWRGRLLLENYLGKCDPASERAYEHATQLVSVQHAHDPSEPTTVECPFLHIRRLPSRLSVKAGTTGTTSTPSITSRLYCDTYYCRCIHVSLVHAEVSV